MADSVVVSASGEVDLATAPDLSRTIEAGLDGGPTRRLIVDLLDVSFMDSSGLAVLVATRQGHPDLPIGLVVGAGIVEDLLRTTALDGVFTLYPSVSDALV